MTKIVIFGSGNHALVIFSEIIKFRNIKFLGFLDDFKKKDEVVIKYKNKKYKNLGKISEFIKKKNDFKGIIGVGSNSIRKKIFKHIVNKDKKFEFISIISKDAIINHNVSIGTGTLVASNCVINTGTKIGNHCIINTSSSIDHDNSIKDFVSIAPRVVTGGNVQIFENSHIGIGSCVKENIKIKKNTLIGAGSNVLKNCYENSIYFGNPAKKIK